MYRNTYKKQAGADKKYFALLLSFLLLLSGSGSLKAAAKEKEIEFWETETEIETEPESETESEESMDFFEDDFTAVKTIEMNKRQDGEAEQLKETSVRIYYLNASGTELAAEKQDLPLTTNVEMAMDVLHRMQEPKTKNLQSAFPLDVTVRDVRILGENLTVNFESSYEKMSPVQEVLLRCAIVRSLTDLPGVSGVIFEINGKNFRNRNGLVQGVMKASDFVDPRSQSINTYRYASLTLYFPVVSSYGTSRKVAKETRVVHYANTTSHEMVVVNQFLQGPKDRTSFYPAFPENVTVKSVELSENMVTVTFSKEFLKYKPAEPVDPQTEIYAFVNSICDSCGVENVKIAVEGASEEDLRYYGTVDLSGPLHRNSEIIDFD